MALHDIVLLGAPGAGKGTLAAELKGKLAIPHVSTGDLLREVIASGSALGKEINGYVSTGALVPDEVIGKMMKELLQSDKCLNGVLLDGFPRTVPQADMLGAILQSLGRSIEHVFYLSVDLNLVIDRLTKRVSCKACGTPYHLVNMPPKKSGICDRCGGELFQREDDKEETIRKRFTTFIEKTQPLIDYYKQHGLLIEIKADKTPAQTLTEVLQYIKE